MSGVGAVWLGGGMIGVPGHVEHARNWVVLHGIFATVAVVALVAPYGETGIKVLVLVVGYNLAAWALAARTKDRALLRGLVVLVPMSALMVLPDWFLSDVLGSLYFPDTGSPFIGTVPVFMAGMWTIALLPPMLLAAWLAARGAAARTVVLAAVAAGLLVFLGAEALAPVIGLWEPRGVAMLGPVAAYVVIPEIVLVAAVYALYVGGSGGAGNAGALSRRDALLVAGIPFLYLGLLASSYQFLG